MTVPIQRITQEQVIEAPQTRSALDKEFPSRFKAGDTTPSVKNLTRFAAAGGGALTIDNFDDGQEGQRIFILGDGDTSVDENANIETGTGGPQALALGKVYRFTRFFGKWYQDA